MTDNELRERFHRFNRALNRADALIEEWTDDPTPITRAEAARMFSFVLALRGWEETDAQLRPTLRAVPTPPQPHPGPTDSPATEVCGAQPRYGTARCDLPPGHHQPPPDGEGTDHSAPLAIGGRLTFGEDHRHAL